MSIDMTTVKQIMHNNKEVIKIEDTNGNTLWEKQTSNMIDFVVTGTGNQNYLFITVNFTDSTSTTYYEATSTSLNKDNISSITVSHRPSSENWYSAVLLDGELVASNVSTTLTTYTVPISNVNSKIEIDLNYYHSSATNTYPRIAFIIRDNTSLNYTPVLFRAKNTSKTYVRMTLNGTDYSPSNVTRYRILDTATSSTLVYMAMASSSSNTSSIGKRDVSVTITSPNTLSTQGTVDSPVYGKYKYIAAQGYRTNASGNFSTYIYINGRER